MSNQISASFNFVKISPQGVEVNQTIQCSHRPTESTMTRNERTFAKIFEYDAPNTSHDILN